MNGDGLLEGDEVTSTSYVCDGAAGTNGVSTLVASASEPPGANCAAGGVKLTFGLDSNDNGVLDTTEVTATSYVCNGPNASDSGASAESDGGDGMAGSTGSSTLGLPPSISLQSSCGETSASSATIQVSNFGGVDVVVTAVNTDNGFSAQANLPLIIPAMGSASLTVQAPLVVSGDIAGSMKTGTLTLITEQPGPSPRAALTSLVNGAQLQFVDASGNPITTQEFDADGECPATGSIRLQNVGNMPVQVQSGQGSEYFVVGPWSDDPIAPGSTAQASVTHEPADGLCKGVEAMSFAVFGGAVCSGSSISLAMTFDISNLATCMNCGAGM